MPGIPPAAVFLKIGLWQLKQNMKEDLSKNF